MLVTLYDNFNHGNRLQNYALQEILKGFGFSVHNLCCPHSKILALKYKPKKERLKIFIKSILSFFKIKIIDIEAFKTSITEYNNLYERTKIFDAFTNKYIDNKIFDEYQNIMSSEKNKDKARWDKYNFAVVGSDQVWNASIVRTTEFLEYFFLKFIEPNKRVNYAPSFGYKDVSDDDYATYKEGLSGFKKLSCREISGCELMKNQFNLNSELVLDPTLLLNSEQWRKISRKPNFKIPEKYVLVYSIGRVKGIYKDALEKFADGREIIEIHDPSDREHFFTDPSEFIYLIDHADGVFTDSFHGTAFSINFQKNFITFGKHRLGWFGDIFGRVDSLLSVVNLSGRAFEACKDFPAGEINYNDVTQKLNLMRESSLKYLRECLNINA